MKQWTRRSFLAASAAAVASPALAAPAPSSETDVVIVGAGAAGIAAARKIAAAGRRFVMIEASNRVGGRCITDTTTFGVPFDRGAHLIHVPDANPLTRLAPRSVADVYPAPSGTRIRIGRRNGRDSEHEELLSLIVKTNRAIGDASRGRTDVACAQALPRDLGDWRPTIEYLLGPYNSGKDLADVSAMDFARAAERDAGAYCRQGFGALLAKVAEGVPVQLSTPVTHIDSGRGTRIEVRTSKGTLYGRYAIVTVSTEVLASGAIRFETEVPRRQIDAASKLRLGSYDHIALELNGNPLGLQRDHLLFEKSAGPRTAALIANVSGTPLAMIEVGGRFGRELSGQGEKAMVDFAIEWLTSLFGGDIRKAVGRSAATRWNAEPWALGAMSAAGPGAQGMRKILAEPVRDRLYFAGEATHETLWGTVGGAWETGERTADLILRKLGVLKDQEEPRAQRQPRRRQ